MRELKKSSVLLFPIRYGEINHFFAIELCSSPHDWNPESAENSFNVMAFVQFYNQGVIEYTDRTPYTEVTPFSWHHMWLYTNRSDYKITIAIDGQSIGKMNIGAENWPKDLIFHDTLILMGNRKSMDARRHFMQIDDLAIMPELNTCIDLAHYHYSQYSPGFSVNDSGRYRIWLKTRLTDYLQDPR